MVSIIVPVYNIEKYLPHCVKSLLGQTYKDLEILLVDDGSTDGSGQLCESLSAGEPKVKVIHKKNGGLSDARNAGLDKAGGDWVLFVDGDDYLAPEAVERLVAVSQPDADFVQFHYHETEDTTWLPDQNQAANPVVCAENTRMWQWLYEKGGVAASSCTKLWARRLFDGIRFEKGILHEDEELMNRILPKCRKVIYTDLVLYGYVTRGSSIVHSGFKPKSMDVFPIMEARTAVLEALGLAQLVRTTRTRMFQTAVWQYCLARRGGYKPEAAALKKQAVRLAREPITPQGQYAMVRKAVKIAPWALNVYYRIRRVSGKT